MESTANPSDPRFADLDKAITSAREALAYAEAHLADEKRRLKAQLSDARRYLRKLEKLRPATPCV